LLCSPFDIEFITKTRGRKGWDRKGGKGNGKWKMENGKWKMENGKEQDTKRKEKRN
jgi:hypothetical protein